MDVTSAITSMSNDTEKSQADNRVTGTTELSQDAFLQLLMTQLKYQDPMNPMDNKDFMMQQAAFTQISELQKLNKIVDNSNQFVHASSLIGKEVTLTDPDNSERTIEGKVTEAKFDGTNASIVINDKTYPMDNILSVKDTEEIKDTEGEVE